MYLTLTSRLHYVLSTRNSDKCGVDGLVLLVVEMCSRENKIKLK